MENVIDIVITAKDEASATIQRLAGTINGAQKSVGSFFEKNQQGLRSIQIASTVALTGVIALGAGAVAQASKMQDLRQQFDTLTWSAERGKKLFMDIQKFAAQTPFDSAQLAAATSTMLGFGVAQDKVMGSMKMLGDISLGNSDRLQSLSLAFAQVTATGKLTGQDLLQMVNAGFNPLEAIAKKTGRTMSELKDSMSKGGISVQMVEEAMRDATSEGGRFFNGMDKASKTFSGVMSTLRDNVGITLASIAGFSDGEVVQGGLIDNLTKAMTAVMPYLESFAQWASQNGTIITVVLGIVGALSAFAAVATTLGFMLPAITAGITTLWTIFGFLLGPVGLVIGAIALLAVAWKTNFLGIQDATSAAWNWITTTFQAGIDWIMATIKPFLDQLQKFWHENGAQIVEGIKMNWALMKVVFTELFEWIKLYVGAAWDVISGIFSIAFTLIKANFQVFFTAISGILTAGMQIINGDWSGAWETVKDTFARIGKIIIETGGAVFEKLHGIITSIVARTEAYITGALTRIKDTLKEIVTLGAANTGTYNPETNMSIAGAKASGGYVGMGQTYLVGERGPELFRPSTSGNITPNDELGGGGGFVFNFTPGVVNIRDEQDIPKLARELSKEFAREVQKYKLGVV